MMPGCVHSCSTSVSHPLVCDPMCIPVRRASYMPGRSDIQAAVRELRAVH